MSRRRFMDTRGRRVSGTERPQPPTPPPERQYVVDAAGDRLVDANGDYIVLN